MSSGQNTSAGKGRLYLWVGLVAVLAVVAAALTLVISSATYSPGGRTVSPALQVAGGSEHVDEEAGLRIRVPAGWRVETQGLPYGTTALDREIGDAEGHDDAAGEADGAPVPGGFVLLGRLTDEYAPANEMDNRQAAAFIMQVMGQQFLPIPGRLADQRLEEVSSRAGDGWAVSVRVVPELEPGAPEPESPVERDGGLAYSAVVGEGQDRWWLTYIGSPADGSWDSPGVEWADEIVERLVPTGEEPLADRAADRRGERGPEGPTI